MRSPVHKVYIGQCCRKDRFQRTELPPREQLRVRWLEHCRPTSGCVAIKKAIAKYGPDNFHKEVLLQVDDAQLNHWERVFVQRFESNKSRYGYNRNDGGEGGGFTLPHVRKAQCQPGTKWMDAVKRPDVVRRKIQKMHDAESRAKVAVTKKTKRDEAIAKLPVENQAAAVAKKERLREATARWRARNRGDTSVANGKRKERGF